MNKVLNAFVALEIELEEITLNVSVLNILMMMEVHYAKVKQNAKL